MIYTDLIFVFCFLPVYYILQFALGEDYEKKLASLVMSLIFILWARPLYYCAFLVLVFAVYIVGRMSRKKGYKLAAGVTSAVTFSASLFFIYDLTKENELRGFVCAFGVLLFALRAFTYLMWAENGGEKNFLDLSIYLISFEFMAISPLCSYQRIKEEIKNRRMSLALLSTGIARFARGLAAVTVIGFALERIRVCALLSGATPYLNCLIGLGVGALEVYTAVSGYLYMSEGLCLMSGMKIKMRDSSFTPRTLMLTHLGYAHLSLAATISGLLSGASAPWLAALMALSCVAAGVYAGLGSGVGAFMAVIFLCILMQKLFEAKKSISAGAFTLVFGLAALLFFACGSFEGAINRFTCLFSSKYEFDMSFSLYSELKRSAWLIIPAVLYVSPLRLLIERELRAKMASGSRAYGAIRTADAVFTIALLLISTVAIISAI